MDVSREELREFLETDLVDVPPDPIFKERLRQHLWGLVTARVAERQRNSDSAVDRESQHGNVVLWDEQ